VIKDLLSNDRVLWVLKVLRGAIDGQKEPRYDHVIDSSLSFFRKKRSQSLLKPRSQYELESFSHQIFKLLKVFFLCTSGLSQEEFRCVHNDNKELEIELYSGERFFTLRK